MSRVAGAANAVATDVANSGKPLAVGFYFSAVASDIGASNSVVTQGSPSVALLAILASVIAVIVVGAVFMFRPAPAMDLWDAMFGSKPPPSLVEVSEASLTTVPPPVPTTDRDEFDFNDIHWQGQEEGVECETPPSMRQSTIDSTVHAYATIETEG
ncbi:Aste57867_5050 [Aphanomyces stellatus]|uniref:Aste57867_5050 protein n=1 Tax=Aphanomyces stellatus TaxID=120398 RepID=A0A485KGB1_9STRA|nr:hypothetical protein As57867_005037 [Aphanomyces stellatus]VFT82131.1 Aste57867_5050 [Aphanomyces stellatus]